MICKCGFVGSEMRFREHRELMKPYVPNTISVALGYISQDKYDGLVQEYEDWKREHILVK